MTGDSIQNKSSCTSKSAQPSLYFWQIQVLAGLSTFWKQSKENIYRSIGSVVKLTWLWSLKDSRISSPKVASYSQPACQGRKAGRQRSGERPPLEEASLAPIERLHNCCTNWHLGTGCILHGATVFIADTMSWTNLASTFPIVPRVRLAQWNKPSEMDVVLYS